MIKKELELKAFTILYNLPESFFDNDDIILDFEIINDLRPDWNYNKGHPCCAGFLHKNMITMYLAESEDDKDFITAVKNHFIQVNVGGKVYALNKDFESGILSSFFGVDNIIYEVRPFSAKYWSKEKFFNELVKDGIIPKIELVDPLGFDGHKCIDAWERYKEGQKSALDDIARHNLNCLLKESLILKHSQHFRDNYNINEKGWLVGIGKKKQSVEGKIVNIYNQDNNAIISVEFIDNSGQKKTIEIRSYYKLLDGKPEFFEGSNWIKYYRFYGKFPEVGDIVKVEPNSKDNAYHILL